MTTDIVLYNSTNAFNFWETTVSIIDSNINEIEEQLNQLPEVLFITTFPPRECGIATYSQDLINALNNQFEDSFTCSICALESETEQHIYKKKPKYILNTDLRNSFIKTAFKINEDDNIKLVVMQHEFGFFAEKEEKFKQFFDSISKPIVFVFHTVLPKPNNALKIKVQDMSAIASSIIVMTKSASDILRYDYDVSSYKISVRQHGTHLVPPLDRKILKEHYQLSHRKVLSTFGLLGSSKSI